jgi:hypothetical protein
VPRSPPFRTPHRSPASPTGTHWRRACPLPAIRDPARACTAPPDLPPLPLHIAHQAGTPFPCSLSTRSKTNHRHPHRFPPFLAQADALRSKTSPPLNFLESCVRSPVPEAIVFGWTVHRHCHRSQSLVSTASERLLTKFGRSLASPSSAPCFRTSALVDGYRGKLTSPCSEPRCPPPCLTPPHCHPRALHEDLTAKESPA